MTATPQAELDALFSGSPYQAYTYSYPHKTAYRELPKPIALRDVWAAEDRSSLFLYVHVPFCEMRCGFCNLFTRNGASEDLTRRYLDQLRLQAERVMEALGEVGFSRLAFGGGTPTILPEPELAALFDIVTAMGASPSAVPTSLETSPETATPERLALAKERGVERLSIGIQSFRDTELKALGRPATTASAVAALERIKACAFPTMNIDLIYGVQGQTLASWLESVHAALRFEPDELYLYPLYVRPLTGLGRRGMVASDARPAMYETARDLLCSRGYEQVSLRMFRRRGSGRTDGPVYCCQEDGMVGIGCGARSYTRELHYADDFAVGASSVKGIIADWVERPARAFEHADYGIVVDDAEQRRRYVIQSISIVTGLERERYRERFGSDVLKDFPALRTLADRGYLSIDDERIVPTAAGLAWADAIGPWFYSDAMASRMKEFELR